MLESWLKDLRHAIRGLRRDPLLAIAATAILAISIGASTTVFSLVNSILLKPLPYPGSERIYWVSERMKRDREGGVSADYYDLRKENRVFEDVAAFNVGTINWTGIETPKQLDVAQVSASFFRVMGVPPMLGRSLTPQEEGRSAPAVVIVSYPFWRSHLGGDASAVGGDITLDGLPNRIIGVMPRGFDSPTRTQIWKPLPLDEASQLPRSPTRLLWQVSMVARLRPAVRPEELDAEMNRLTGLIQARYLKEWLGGLLDLAAIVATPLQQRITGDLRPALRVLSGAVGLVLLIACVNLANLLLARASTRQRELAVRLALGSSRSRMTRQMLTESLVLALPGGLAGVAIARLAIDLMNANKPAWLLRYPEISMDLPVLALTFSVTLLTGLFFGAAPAFAAARIRIFETLKGASGASGGGRRSGRLRQSLVVAELGVSLVLLIGAGLLARSFLKLTRVELGFLPERLLTLCTNLTPSLYPTGTKQMRFYDDVLARIKRLPMVRRAAVSTDLPLSGEFPFSGLRFQVEGRAPLPRAQWPSASLTVVSREFFATLEMPVRRGRAFDSQDTPRSADAIVVNEAFARRVFPGEDPIGRRIAKGPNGSGGWTIAGVVSNIRAAELAAEPAPLIYRCTCQSGDRDVFFGRMALLVRTEGDPRTAVHAVEGQVYAQDRNQPVFDVMTMEQRVEQSLAPPRFQLVLIGGFAVLAMILAAAGVYGVTSYLVAQRTREIGIRMAMGARRADVLLLVMGESIVLVLAAVVAGLGGAWALTRYGKTLLYGVTALDGPTFAVTPLVLAATVLIASLGPARRAARVDPMTALRDE